MTFGLVVSGDFSDVTLEQTRNKENRLLLLTWSSIQFITKSFYNTSVIEMTAADQLDATFIALADPTRRAILARLMQGEASVNALAETFEVSQPAISKHLKI